MRRRAALLVTLSSLLGALAVQSAQASPERWLVAPAEISYAQTDRPPGEEGNWQAVTLPYHWTLDEYAERDRAWFRLRVPVGTPDVPLAIYLWRYSMNARVYLGDALLADGGSFTSPPARNLHRPMFAALPGDPRSTYLYVHLRVVRHYGYLMPPAIGPLTELQPMYTERFFNQITLSQILFILTLSTAVLGGVLWLGDRTHTAYLYFSGACFTWCVYTVNPILGDVPVSMRFWLWLLHFSLDAFVVFLVLFAHRQFNLTARRVEQLLVPFLLVAGLAYWFAWAEPRFPRHSSLMHLPAILFAAYLTWATGRAAVHQRRWDAGLFAATMAVLAVLGVHDLVTSAGFAYVETSFLSLSLAVPLVFLVLSAELVWKLRTDNVSLAGRVRAATAELEESFERREALERQHAASEERERIYRDLHDDIGSRLLTLVYEANDERQAELARETLRELRSIATPARLEDRAVQDWAAEMFTECERRCAHAGVQLIWQVEGDGVLSADRAYHLVRIVRELVSNVLNHADASQLSMAFTVTDANLVLRADDDGIGFDGSSTGDGAGVLNLTERTRLCDGEIAWESAAEGGTRVRVRIPLNGG